MKKSFIQNGFNVLIKKDAKINFPTICVLCGENCEDQSMNISGVIDESFGRWKQIFLGSPKLSIPVHSDCAIIKRKNTTRRGFFHAIIYIITAGIIYYLNRSIDLWFLFLPFLPVYLIDRFVLDRYWYREPILFSVNNDRYEITFTDKGYAEQFESLNDTNLCEERLLKNFGAIDRR